jgi:hypothetical protein
VIAHRENPGEPLGERDARNSCSAFKLIDTTVHDQLADLDAITIANALFSVAANVLNEAGMTHADIAHLLERFAGLSRKAESETRSDA